MSKKTALSKEGDEGIIAITPVQLDPSHAKEMFAIARAVPQFVSEKEDGPNVVRFAYLIGLYHADPTLLDKIVVELIEVLMSHVTLPETSGPLSDLSMMGLRLLREVINVSGYKTVIRFLPHEVFVLPKLLSTLEYYASVKITEAETFAVSALLVWFIIVCRNPFDFHTFAASGEVSYPDRILACLNKLRYFYVKYATLTLAETLTRHADNADVLVPAIDSALANLQTVDSTNYNAQIADLALLSGIFKKGKRPELIRYGYDVIDRLTAQTSLKSPNVAARLQTIKLIQRIALVYLKAKPAGWRYRCGVRSLEANLAGTSALPEVSKNLESEDDDVPELAPDVDRLVSTILDTLFLGIIDADNNVRATSAKGIARIASRLPETRADALVTRIFESTFDAPVAEASQWHGGAMAIAELSQRGCILPTRLPAVMAVVDRALQFDDILRTTAINVRDAACYICWAFARGFEKRLLAPLLTALGPKLVAIALFDHSVNVRRAASAAFQENVGRNQGFPDGIRVAATIDYQALGRLKLCYGAVCDKVATSTPYIQPLMSSLVDVYVGHWDEALHYLAADTLRELAKLDPIYAVEAIVPRLAAKLDCREPDEKQGGLVSLGAVLRGLWESDTFDISKVEIASVKAAVPKLAKTFDSAYVSGSKLVLKGIVSFIENYAATAQPLTDEELSAWHAIVDRSLSDVDAEKRVIAQRALQNLMRYYVGAGEQRRAGFLAALERYFPALESKQEEFIRIGAALALGSIPVELLMESTAPDSKELLAQRIVSKLVALEDDKDHAKWFEARVAAFSSVEKIICNVGIQHFDKADLLRRIRTASRDSTRTIRGFVGLYIRHAAIGFLSKLVSIYEHQEPAVFTHEEITSFAQLLVEQCCERIDRMREFAAQQLESLLKAGCFASVPDRDRLVDIFENGDNKWSIDAFQPFAPLLISDAYRENVLRGFVNSIGGTIVWVREKGLSVLGEFFDNHSDKASEFFALLTKMIVETRSTPVECVLPISTLSHTFVDGMFIDVEKDPDSIPEFRALVNTIIKFAYEKNLRVRESCIATLGILLQLNIKSKTFGEVRKTMIRLLKSVLPVIRAKTAEHLYKGITILDVTNGIDLSELGDMPQLLMETDWRGSDFAAAADAISNQFSAINSTA
uniref:Tubulin-specific chaperone D n=1 Tax=Panagrellus redivivus TaxID=6233 RepID=A0A7E4W5P1_PANRE